MTIFQKQPPRGALRKSCSENMQQIYWRTPKPKCDFNKVANYFAVISGTANGSNLFKFIIPLCFQL